MEKTEHRHTRGATYVEPDCTDALTECDYERIRAQLHHALRGNGNPPQFKGFWLAGRYVSMWRGGGRDDNNT